LPEELNFTPESEDDFLPPIDVGISDWEFDREFPSLPREFRGLSSPFEFSGSAVEFPMGRDTILSMKWIFPFTKCL
jgi:hypothetical protein